MSVEDEDIDPEDPDVQARILHGIFDLVTPAVNAGPSQARDAFHATLLAAAAVFIRRAGIVPRGEGDRTEMTVEVANAAREGMLRWLRSQRP